MNAPGNAIKAERKKWSPKPPGAQNAATEAGAVTLPSNPVQSGPADPSETAPVATEPKSERKKWAPKTAAVQPVPAEAADQRLSVVPVAETSPAESEVAEKPAEQRKKWQPKPRS